jgi:hypothetical protein
MTPSEKPNDEAYAICQHAIARELDSIVAEWSVTRNATPDEDLDPDDEYDEMVALVAEYDELDQQKDVLTARHTKLAHDRRTTPTEMHDAFQKVMACVARQLEILARLNTLVARTQDADGMLHPPARVLEWYRR